MIAKRIEGGYQLESPSINGIFVVKLILTESGEEKIETCSTAAGVCFPIQELDSGTIRRIVGPDRWKVFEEMKEKGIEQMFIDPQADGRRVQAPRTW